MIAAVLGPVGTLPVRTPVLPSSCSCAPGIFHHSNHLHPNPASSHATALVFLWPSVAINGMGVDVVVVFFLWLCILLWLFVGLCHRYHSCCSCCRHVVPVIPSHIHHQLSSCGQPLMKQRGKILVQLTKGLLVVHMVGNGLAMVHI